MGGTFDDKLHSFLTLIYCILLISVNTSQTLYYGSTCDPLFDFALPGSKNHRESHTSVTITTMGIYLIKYLIIYSCSGLLWMMHPYEQHSESLLLEFLKWAENLSNLSHGTGGRVILMRPTKHKFMKRRTCNDLNSVFHLMNVWIR